MMALQDIILDDSHNTNESGDDEEQSRNISVRATADDSLSKNDSH
jgi:hypothetical protein